MTSPVQAPPHPECTICSRLVEWDGLDVCSRHVREGLGISYRQLDHWVRCGYLRPTVAEPGTGVPRSWPASEVETARRMGRLAAAGVMPEKAAGYAREGWPDGEIAPGVRLVIEP